VRAWSRPWHDLRAELGLPPIGDDPLFEGLHSPERVLCLFSHLLAEKQPDWPAQTVITGFPFYDQHDGIGLPPELERFLNNGPPPIVFTLGSSAVMDPGRFYETSIAAARHIGARGVLLTGKDGPYKPASVPEGIIACNYAPFSELFPRCAASVHQGGVGTTGQAMRSGRPMLVMPYSHDQFDNAARVTRLGIARTVYRGRYTPRRAAALLQQLLHERRYAERARAVGDELEREDGVGRACVELEQVLGGVPRT
jgi:UDP:flavonoid glycosyltransferase YjiC (YdhE family)